MATDAVDVATLLRENKKLQQENASLRDRMLRALAEAENVRSQADRAIADARQFAISEFARELLTVVDNLQRTVEAAETQLVDPRVEESALLQGVQATLRALLQTLERFGVQPIEALGKPFDPNVHEAIMEEDDSSQPPGIVTRVVENGYTLRGRLLRPARVVVSKKSSERSTGDATAEPAGGDLGMLWGSPVDP
ncbi:MAG: nucleotide exchange factor GrpE [Bradyrhizobium sp.]